MQLERVAMGLGLVMLLSCRVWGAPVPNPGVAQLKRGATLMQRGDLAGAEAAFTAAVRANPRDARAYYQRGVCRERQKKVPAAIKDYRRAIALDAKLAQAHNNLGALLQEQGESEEAIEPLRRAVQLKPDYGEAWFNLGLAHFDRGQFAQAAKAYRKAERLRPGDVDLQINLGGALQRVGDLAGAVAALTRAVKIKPNDALARANLGRLLLARAGSGAGQRKALLGRAARELERAVELDSGYEAAWLALARVRVRQGHAGQAQAVLQRGIEKLPRSATLWCTLGKVHRKAKRLDRAIAAYRRCASLDNKRGEAQLLLGLAHAAKGDCRRARRSFAKYVALQRLGKDAMSKLMARCGSKRRR
jgi:tetratricopeptide (TPR) repeat protein